MSQRCKLHSDLILQARQQRDPDQRSPTQRTFNAVAKFSPGGFAISFRTQFLIHAFASEIVNQGSLFRGEMSTNHGQILAYRSVGEKLSNQRLAIRIGLCEEQNAGCETIGAMDY